MEQMLITPATAEPDISVIIPAHDAAVSIRRALDSVARQEGVCPEVIVADDASTDGTAQTVEAWGRTHPGTPLSLVRLENQVYALRARLAALGLARAMDVMYLDADDTWAGSRRVARALARKRRMGCEILHFRTTSFLDGKNEGELLWAAPPLGTRLTGKEVFAAYARMDYIPLVIWNKIYSRPLLRKAAALVGDSEIYCFEDKFFVSLVLMCASSWTSANEYIYQYNRPRAYPEHKTVRRIHDLLELMEKVEGLFPVLGIDAPARRDYLYFLKKRLVYHVGRLSMTVEKKLSEGVSPLDILAELTPWLPLAEALAVLTASAHKNAQRLGKISRRLYEDAFPPAQRA